MIAAQLLGLCLTGCTAGSSFLGRSPSPENVPATAGSAVHITAADPMCAAPGSVVDPTLPAQSSHSTLIIPPSATSSVPPVPLQFPEGAACPPTGTTLHPDHAASGVTASGVEECRREAEQLKRQMKTMQSEVDAYRRSSEVIVRKLQTVAQDNQKLQQEMMELQRAAEQQQKDDLQSLQTLSQMLEQQLPVSGPPADSPAASEQPEAGVPELESLFPDSDSQVHP